MSLRNNKYIEFDSTYRDRSQYPNPAEFTVLSEQPEYSNKNASDPVSLGSMVYPRPSQTNPITFQNFGWLFIYPSNTNSTGECSWHNTNFHKRQRCVQLEYKC